MTKKNHPNGWLRLNPMFAHLIYFFNAKNNISAPMANGIK